MSYIGASPNSAAFLTDQFSGNGSTTTFTLSTAPAGTTSILVSVSGVLQDPTTYSVVGTTLTLGGAAPTGTGNISVRYLGIPASGVVTTAYRTVTEFTATAGQTTFTPPSYSVGFIAVYLNGARLGGGDFTASNGTTIVLATGASVDDLVVTESFYISSVANAIPNIPGAVTETNLASSILQPASISDKLNTSTGYLDLPTGTTSERPASPVNGMTRYNTTINEFEVYQNGRWTQYQFVYTTEYLVVAGGGGGGYQHGSGGGAGGFRTATGFTLVPGTSYTVTVGAGGVGASGGNGTGTFGTNGANSVFDTITSIGGGGGASYPNFNGRSGGSGGGGGSDSGSGASGTSGQGNAGGNGAAHNTGGGGGGGGGGAGAVGGNAIAGGSGGAGDGGAGLQSNIDGNNYYYAGGGGGGTIQTGSLGAGDGGIGGGGGGGNAASSTGRIGGGSARNSGGNGGQGSGTSAPGGAGGANTGGGGGAAGNFESTGGTGGSGIVILRYLGGQKGTGGTITSSGGYTIHTFTSSGTYTA